jgi:hypothetical protein
VRKDSAAFRLIEFAPIHSCVDKTSGSIQFETCALSACPSRWTGNLNEVLCCRFT